MLSPYNFLLPVIGIFGIYSISNESILLSVVALISFISILGLSIAHFATPYVMEAIYPKLIELRPKPEPTYREGGPKKDNPHSDIVWTMLKGSTPISIFDQDNVDGTTLISMLAETNTRVETYLVNGVQYIGISIGHISSNTQPSGQIKRACNAGFFDQNRVNITYRREAL